MATTPDPHPDSPPQGEADAIEQTIHPTDEEREGVEDPPRGGASTVDSPGTPGGTAGTGGDNRVQDPDFER